MMYEGVEDEGIIWTGGESEAEFHGRLRNKNKYLYGGKQLGKDSKSQHMYGTL